MPQDIHTQSHTHIHTHTHTHTNWISNFQHDGGLKVKDNMAIAEALGTRFAPGKKTKDLSD